jgi:hypothetical protein
LKGRGEQDVFDEVRRLLWVKVGKPAMEIELVFER